ncbi:MAG TPA: hypothetical protein VNL16_02670 [Chloroflexota bacterium]|nr:hypothetical protein [Chloroflexota bacterium]
MFGGKATTPRPSSRIAPVVLWPLVVLIVCALVVLRLDPTLLQTVPDHPPVTGSSEASGVDLGTPLGGTPAPDFALVGPIRAPAPLVRLSRQGRGSRFHR